MTLQIMPIGASAGFLDTTGRVLTDQARLDPANTERPEFRFRPILDGGGFQVNAMWMQLSQLWTFTDLLTRDGAVVTLGIPVTGSGVDLLRVNRSDPNVPPGQLWYAFDDGRTGKPARFDWRGTATLYYRPLELVQQVAGTDRALL